MKYLYVPSLLIIAIAYTNYFEARKLEDARVLRTPASTKEIKIEKKEMTWDQKLKNLFK